MYTVYSNTKRPKYGDRWIAEFEDVEDLSPGCRTFMDMSNLSMDSRLFHVYSMKKPGLID
jgi:hypothetical protein